MQFIETDQEYEAAVDRIWELMPDGEDFWDLVFAVERYEDVHWGPGCCSYRVPRRIRKWLERTPISHSKS